MWVWEDEEEICGCGEEGIVMSEILFIESLFWNQMINYCQYINELQLKISTHRHIFFTLSSNF